jgi:hypothetical protein
MSIITFITTTTSSNKTTNNNSIHFNSNTTKTATTVLNYELFFYLSKYDKNNFGLSSLSSQVKSLYFLFSWDQ